MISQFNNAAVFTSFSVPNTFEKLSFSNDSCRYEPVKQNSNSIDPTNRLNNIKRRYHQIKFVVYQLY